jgi:hypothetical protein
MKTIELLKKRLEEFNPTNKLDANIKYRIESYIEDYEENQEETGWSNAKDLLGTLMDECHDGAFTDSEIGDKSFTEWALNDFIDNYLPLYQDMEAAELYLESWQIDECPNHPQDRNYIGDEQVKANEERKAYIDKTLLDNGYASSKTTLYDNEGCPIIQWRDPEFDCEAFLLEERNQDQ